MDHEAEPPPDSSFARILDNAQQSLRQQLTEEVQERETRLVGLLQSIGHPSLDSLENFIYIHGASKVVPLASLPPPAGGPAGETQTQLLLSPTKRDQRHRDRKTELTALKGEVTRVKAELEYAQLGLKKEQEARERVTRDLDRLLGVAMESQAAKGKESQEEGMEELKSALEKAYDEIERMDEVEKELTERLAEKSGQVEQLRMGAEGREKAERRVEELEEELVRLRQRCEDLETEVEGFKEKFSALTSAAVQAPSPSLPSQHAPPASLRGPPPPTSPRSSLRRRSPSAQPSQPQPAIMHSSATLPSHSSAPAAPAQPPPAADPTPKLSVPQPLRRHSSSTAQLSLYDPLLTAYLDARRSVRKNQEWCDNQWSSFVRANGSYLAKLPELPSPPTKRVEESKEYPTKEELGEKVGEVYRELEGEEKVMSKLRGEWSAWRKRAIERYEEVRKLAREIQERAKAGGVVAESSAAAGGEEGTLRLSVRKQRPVPGTGRMARAATIARRGEEMDTPSRVVKVASQAVAAQDTPLAALPRPTPIAQPIFASARAPSPAPIARSSTPEPAPLPAPSAVPAVPAISPPRASPSATTLITPFILTQTPRKTKRRSDILHLSASGQPPPSAASGGVMSTVKKQGAGGGGRMLRDALEAAREKDVLEGVGVRGGLLFSPATAARALELVEQAGALEEEEDVFAAPPPRSSQPPPQPPRRLSVHFPQPESSWEQEPDTQSSGAAEAVTMGSSQWRHEDDEEGEEEQEEERSRVLVPPSSAEESLSPRKPATLQAFIEPPSRQTNATPSLARPSTHRRAPPPPPPEQPDFSPPPPSARCPPGFNTQDLIAAAEQEQEYEEPTVRPRQRMEMPPSAQSRARPPAPGAGAGSSKKPATAYTSTSAKSKPPTTLSREKKRALSPDPVAIKLEPSSPPRLALALRNLGGAFGSPPAPAADWKAVERSEKGNKRARERSEEPSRAGKERKRRRKEREEDVKPRLAGSKRRRSDETDEEDEGEEEEEQDERPALRPLDDTNFSDLDNTPGGEDDPDGHHWMRRLHARRKLEVEKMRQDKAAKSAPAKPVIEINPARNGGKDYHYKETVRNKEARKHMHAHTCEGCAGYYEADERAFDHAANCKKPGGSKSRSKAPAPRGNHFLDERHRQMEERLQKTSRHRAQHKPDPEPPDYWQMGFPDTQRVEQINRQAEKDREEKRLYQEAQAQTDGFYRYRNN